MDKKAYMKAYNKQYAEDNAEKLFKYKRNWHLFKKYGITEEDYNNMLVAQDYKCAICLNEFETVPYVDHDHISNEVRGLLCMKCNAGLGMFSDNLKVILRAAAYLGGS